MVNNDDLTILARVKGWEIFSPDWDYLRQHPAMELGSLCSLSVGLDPTLADPAWVVRVATPHFDGSSPDLHDFAPTKALPRTEDEQIECDRRAASLKEFLRRVHIAPANLTPLGSLRIAVGEPNGERTLVRVADFAEWAEGMGWSLPGEFPRAPDERKRETPEDRRQRLRNRKGELISKGVKPWQVQIAQEEGISTTRVRQIILGPKKNNPPPYGLPIARKVKVKA